MTTYTELDTEMRGSTKKHCLKLKKSERTLEALDAEIDTLVLTIKDSDTFIEQKDKKIEALYEEIDVSCLEKDIALGKKDKEMDAPP